MLLSFIVLLSQSVNELDDFLLNFEKLLNQITQLKLSFSVILLGDFNAIGQDHGGVRI